MKRKYKLNESFFKQINTEEKAYFLGLLYSDGCMLESTHTIKIGLKSSDNKLLEDLSSIIYEDKRPLSFYESKTSYSGNCVTATLIITSKMLYNDLLTHGLTPRKSLTLRFPETVPDSLISHFLRGYFDGDGWICISNRKYKNQVSGRRITCGFLCSFEFSSKLTNILINMSIKPYVVIDHRCNSIIDVRVPSNKGSKILLDYLYKDATIYLQRKYNKYKEMFK